MLQTQKAVCLFPAHIGTKEYGAQLTLQLTLQRHLSAVPLLNSRGHSSGSDEFINKTLKVLLNLVLRVFYVAVSLSNVYC